MKYFFKLDTGLVGSRGYEVLETDYPERDGWELAVQNAEAYFDVLDVYGDEAEEMEEDGVQWGVDWISTDDVQFSYEPYDPEKHDGYLY